jgi:hypothetical protein
MQEVIVNEKKSKILILMKFILSIFNLLLFVIMVANGLYMVSWLTLGSHALYTLLAFVFFYSTVNEVIAPSSKWNFPSAFAIQ